MKINRRTLAKAFCAGNHSFRDLAEHGSVLLHSAARVEQNNHPVQAMANDVIQSERQ